MADSRQPAVLGIAGPNNISSAGQDSTSTNCCIPSSPNKWCYNCKNIHRECWCFIFLCMIAAISVIIIASIKIDRWIEWENSTEEICKVLTNSKRYLSGCEGDGDGVPYYKFEYTAIAFDKCGNQTLNMEDNEADNCIKDGNEKVVQEEYKCYVLDCSKFKFLNPQHWYYQQSINLFIPGGVIIFMVISCLCGGMIFGWTFNFMYCTVK